MSDVHSSFDLSKVPPRSQVGVLDGEIADEGQRVILSDGNTVPWDPPPAQAVMPDWSKIKSIRHYFNRKSHQVYPAWLYHPTENARLVKNADEAKALGIFYRRATVDERGRYGVEAVWDWGHDCLWRAQPYSVAKFDPHNPGQGKTYVPTVQNPALAQSQLIETLIPAVAAAVAKSLNANGPGKPASIDKDEWEQFLQFKAWQKASEVVMAETVDELPEEPGNALNADQDRALWLAEAERKGIKVDKRWGIDRLKSEVEKAA